MSIFQSYNLELSADQQTVLKKLEAFLSGDKQVFLLKGYAGSGKTTILKGLAKYLKSIERPFALMAPTGRAAKVIREKTEEEAFTIHKSIFSYNELVEVEEGESFYYYYKIKEDASIYNKVFIVDEASMLSNAKSESEFFRFGTSHLLNDLISHARIQETSAKTKIIFIGDPCQLPPVTDSSSVALDAEYLKQNFHVQVEEAEMKEVMRQGDESGILHVAGKIRKSITSGYFNDFNLTQNGKDIFNPSYEAFWNKWNEAQGTKVVIASKNSTCRDMNEEVRMQKYGNQLPIQKGDIVIMGANNYKKGVFNGEFAVVNEVGVNPIIRDIHLKGRNPVTLTWRYIELIFPDSEDNENKVVKGQMLENFLYGETYLKPEETQALYVDFKSRHPDLIKGTDAFTEAISTDEFFNCLYLKYGYAVTCHKAQGGEWDNAFVIWDHDNSANFNYFKDTQRREGKTNANFYRWAYTAVTRATQSLYALTPPRFSSYSRMTIMDEAVAGALRQLTAKSKEEIEISASVEIDQRFIRYQISDQSISVKEHFLAVEHAIAVDIVKLEGWERKGYEIVYQFKKVNDMASIKTWVDGNEKFKGKYQVIPKGTSNAELASTIIQRLQNLPRVVLKEISSTATDGSFKMDLAQSEKWPFTLNLFEDLKSRLLPKTIIISKVDHLQYKERYLFIRGTEKARLDFVYDGSGFWGIVSPVTADCNSPKLLKDIISIVKQLKV